MYKNLFNDHIIFSGKDYLNFSSDIVDYNDSINPPLHTHDYLELSLVEQGHAIYHIGDKHYTMEKGDIFLINNIEVHGIETLPNTEIINSVIHFEPRLVWSGIYEFDSRYLEVFFKRNDYFIHKLDNENPTTSQIRSLFLDIKDEFVHTQPEYELMIKVKLLNILALLLRHYDYVKKVQTPSKNIHEIDVINKVLDYIDENFTDDVSLNTLSSIANLNPSYLSTYFKKYNGISLNEYITRKRIHCASDYLKTTDKTILDISTLSGFNNTANFNKSFKRITGMTPSEFRIKK